MKDGKVIVDEKSFDLGKNGCHRPSGLSGRLIVDLLWSGRKADETLAVQDFLKFNNLRGRTHHIS